MDVRTSGHVISATELHDSKQARQTNRCVAAAGIEDMLTARSEGDIGALRGACENLCIYIKFAAIYEGTQ